jgi:hypothetical protein
MTFPYENPQDPTSGAQVPTAPWMVNNRAVSQADITAGRQQFTNAIHLFEGELDGLRQALIHWIFQQFMIAVQGFFTEGEDAIHQLTTWATNLVENSLNNVLKLLGLQGIESFVQYLQNMALISDITTALGQFGADLKTALQNIPHLNVQSIFNGVATAEGTIGADIQGVLGNAYAGVTNLANQGEATLAGLQQQLQYALSTFLGYNFAAPSTPTSGSFVDRTQTTINNRAISRPLTAAADPTIDPVFDLTLLAQNSTLPTLAVTQNTSAVGLILTPDNAVKQQITWIGYPTGGTFGSISSFIVNIYQVDPVAGGWTLLYSTPNVVGSVAAGASPVRNYLTLGSTHNITTLQGEIFAVEIQILGGGTYNIVGLTNYIPTNTGQYPPTVGAARTGSPVAAAANVSNPSALYGSATPWFGMSGQAGATQYPPELTTYSTPGTFTFAQLPWAVTYDLAIFGGGGSGFNGSFALAGRGGSAGASYGTQVPASSVTGSITVTVGAGGGVGPNGLGSGADTVIVVPGVGTYTASGGAAATGDVSTGGNRQGGDAANVTVGANTYLGGAGGASSQDSGQQPGGGGAGGSAQAFQSRIYGGAGGTGIAYILAHT